MGSKKVFTRDRALSVAAFVAAVVAGAALPARATPPCPSTDQPMSLVRVTKNGADQPLPATDDEFVISSYDEDVRAASVFDPETQQPRNVSIVEAP